MNNTSMMSKQETLLRVKSLPKYSQAASVKLDISNQIEKELYKSKLTKGVLANRMGTSRSALHRLLDPENLSVTLNTLEKVALALNKELKIELA